MNTVLTFENLTAAEASELIGFEDRNLDCLCELFAAQIVFRDNRFMINCEKAEELEDILTQMLQLVRSSRKVNEQEIRYLVRCQRKAQTVDLGELKGKVLARTHSGKAICPKTQGQLSFIEAMEKKTIVFAAGPAGTGKTYLAVAYAVSMLKKGEVHKIILTRPAVEAGENLGFLPGDLKEKVDPYLRPLYDALHDLLGNEATDRLIEKGTIEIAPLAYMRGRTLEDAVIILDEAQNTTPSQMKMFLTRLGNQSRMIITGDATQVDLPRSVHSGLMDAIKLLKGIPEIGILQLSGDDVVRHPLVQKIIDRYSEKGE